MPKTLTGAKRPADVISNAVMVMRIATGEIDESLTEDGKSKAAVELGRKGGMAREKSSRRGVVSKSRTLVPTRDGVSVSATPYQPIHHLRSAPVKGFSST